MDEGAIRVGWKGNLSGSDGRGIYQGGMTGLIRWDERAYRGASLS